jgi:glycine/D-amino acid oxidase-like deaminating enzyme
MLDLAAGLSYHWMLNGLPYQYPVLEHDLHCEVLVVGSGITGALCAHACAKAGLGVVVVDGRAVGTGSTAASTALVQYELDTPLHELMDRMGERDAVRVYQLAIEAVEGLLELARALGTTDVKARSSFQFASRRSDEKDLKKEHALRTAGGIKVDLLSRSETRSILPSIEAVGLLSAVAAEMDPYAFTHRLLQEVLRLGGSVFDRTEVVRSRRKKGGGAELLTRSGHRITSDHLVMATGYESQQHLRKPVMQLHSTYAVASVRISQGTLWHQDCLIWETARPYLYLRTTPDRRAIIGGLDEPFRDPVRRDRLLPRKTKALERAVHRLLPDLPFEPEYPWCGTFGTSRDGLPYFDRDPRLGAWFVLGTGGNGIALSHAGAAIVRDGILGRTNADARLFRFAPLIAPRAQPHDRWAFSSFLLRIEARIARALESP